MWMQAAIENNKANASTIFFCAAKDGVAFEDVFAERLNCL
jgi:hypothetical protein